MGVNLLEVIKRYDYKGVPLHLARILAKQCLIGLDFLHWECRLIHTDLKPENVILNLEHEELDEIKEKGYLTTTNVLNLDKKVKDRLRWNVYDKWDAPKPQEIPLAELTEEEREKVKKKKKNKKKKQNK